MKLLIGLTAAFVLSAGPAVARAGNYLGMLKIPPAEIGSGTGLYSLSRIYGHDLAAAPGAQSGFRLKLGYKYSPYLAVEGQAHDFTRQGDPFATPSNLLSGFRNSGFGVDTIATLPLWRFSFYGRLGAYRGDTPFSGYSTSLLADGAARGTRMRYGLGMRYDFTRSLGIHAEVERYSPLGSIASEPDSDLLTVGVKWRF